MDKKNALFHTMEYYLAMKGNRVTTHNETWWTSKHFSKWKKPDTRNCILYYSIYMKCQKNGNSKKTQKFNGALGCRDRIMKINSKCAWEILLGWWKCSTSDLWWWRHKLVNLLGEKHTHWIVHLKQMNYMIYNICLNKLVVFFSFILKFTSLYF